MTKAPTINDVARAAGVSAATVSRALSGSGIVNEALHERIMVAIDETGYRPQRIHKPSTQMPWLPVITTEIVQHFHLMVIEGIQEQAEQKGMLTMIIRLTKGSDQLSLVLRQMRAMPLAGLMSVGTEFVSFDWEQHFEEAKTPIVVLNTETNHAKIGSILVNFEAAAAQAVQHLLDLNHIRIAYLSDMRHPVSAAQLRGIRAGLARRDLVLPDDHCISASLTPEGASQGVSRIVNMPLSQRPTAIFAFDDEVAIDVLNALRYYGLRVPEDISVIGFDNIPMSAHTYPPLTTVDVPKRRTGRQMVNMLDELQRNDGRPFGSTIVEAQLIVRGSSGPAPTSG